MKVSKFMKIKESAIILYRWYLMEKSVKIFSEYFRRGHLEEQKLYKIVVALKNRTFTKWNFFVEKYS